MSTQKTQACRKKSGREVSFDFKLSLIDEISNGLISANYASKKYNISRGTIAYWIKKLSCFEQTKKGMSLKEENKKLKERIEELEFDEAISNFKKIYAENVKPPYQTKIYFNKAEGLIDVGFTDFQIPIKADVIYKFDTSYNPPQNVLVFSWKAKNESETPPNFPKSKDPEKSLTILFKDKDGCYNIIDAFVKIRNLTQNN